MRFVASDALDQHQKSKEFTPLEPDQYRDVRRALVERHDIGRLPVVETKKTTMSNCTKVDAELIKVAHMLQRLWPILVLVLFQARSVVVPPRDSSFIRMRVGTLQRDLLARLLLERDSFLRPHAL